MVLYSQLIPFNLVFFLDIAISKYFVAFYETFYRHPISARPLAGTLLFGIFFQHFSITYYLTLHPSIRRDPWLSSDFSLQKSHPFYTAKTVPWDLAIGRFNCPSLIGSHQLFGVLFRHRKFLTTIRLSTAYPVNRTNPHTHQLFGIFFRLELTIAYRTYFSSSSRSAPPTTPHTTPKRIPYI